MNIIKIAFTGGPCAGKTTMISNLREYLEEKGIKYLVVPETATELIDANLKVPEKDINFFQELVLKKQLSKENITLEYANMFLNKEENVIIIYDRGIIDNKAYFPNLNDFKTMIDNNGLSEIELLDSYDLVFDLISLAVTQPDKYNLSNHARFETPKEARERDERTTQAWAGHRNIKVINTELSIEEEFDLIKSYVEDLLNSRQSKKIRTFELDRKNTNLEGYNYTNSRIINVKEYYLNTSSSQGIKYILRERTMDNKSTYLLDCVVYDNDEMVNIYQEVIPKTRFESLLDFNGCSKSNNYREINASNKQQYYKIKDMEDGSLILEVDINSLRQDLNIPDNFSIIRETTGEGWPIRRNGDPRLIFRR